jgi:L-aspartate oxidase
MIGGCEVDTQARTSIPGLWAAGEVTSSGLHGANRLASNSLLEGLVYGAIAGRNASECASQNPSNELRVLPIESPGLARSDQEIDLADIRNAVRSLMWRNVGVKRKEERLSETIQTIQQYCSYVLSQNLDGIEGWELQNLLTVSLQMAVAAQERKESRGVHFRIDYPAIDNTNWRKHLTISRMMSGESSRSTASGG